MADHADLARAVAGATLPNDWTAAVEPGPDGATVVRVASAASAPHHRLAIDPRDLARMTPGDLADHVAGWIGRCVAKDAR